MQDDGASMDRGPAAARRWTAVEAPGWHLSQHQVTPVAARFGTQLHAFAFDAVFSARSAEVAACCPLALSVLHLWDPPGCDSENERCDAAQHMHVVTLELKAFRL